MKQYDPNWPFPQYDEDGKQLLPPDWNKKKKPVPALDLDEFEDAPF